MTLGIVLLQGPRGEVFLTSEVHLCYGNEAGSYLRLKDSCITQLKAQGHSRTCNESKEEEGTPVS